MLWENEKQKGESDRNPNLSEQETLVPVRVCLKRLFE